jgi:hypothetical protein
LDKKLPQRGISGRYRSGADAIIVSGKRCGYDDYENLKYVAEWRIGANSLVLSYLQNTLIRVFRSAKYLCIRGTDIMAWDRRCTSNLYRYDGLYKIVNVGAPSGKITSSFLSPTARIVLSLTWFSRDECSFREDPKRAFEFYLNRHSPFFVPDLSFEDTANGLFRLSSKRKQPADAIDQKRRSDDEPKRFKSKDDGCMNSGIPPKSSWANDYGPKDFSW